MIKRKDELSTKLEPNLKGGEGTVRVLNILEQQEMFGLGRLFAISIIPPGASIGKHTHEGDFEVYYILKGRARLNDNGQVAELGPGDVSQCRDGHFHSIENIGEEDLEYLAVILYTNEK